MNLTFDIETDGLLDHMTHIKCLNIIDVDTMQEYRYTDYEFYLDAYTGKPTDVRCPRDGDIDAGMAHLQQAEEINGQNIVGFDIAALIQVRGFEYTGRTFDTKTVSMLLYPDLHQRDILAIRKGKLKLEPYLCGTHRLVSWGIRLGEQLKEDFKPSNYGAQWTWNNYPFSKECDDYCMQDVRSNVVLTKHLKKRAAEQELTAECLDLEHEVGRIIALQQDYGWLFDQKAAEALTSELMQEKIGLESELINTFDDFYQRNGKQAVTKRTMKRFVESEHGSVKRKYKGATQKGWYQYVTEGCVHQPIALTAFNPGSRTHIADRLTKVFGWVPEEFTPKGMPTVDESVLGTLRFPEAQLLTKYFRVTKMLGQLADGKGSWLKYVRKNGRIHGSVNPCGAVTGRMTHSKPNVAQADKDKRMRSLWIAGPGMKLVGCDADGLELRCLAHFLAKYDGGEYIKVILEGKKEDGSDMHSRNQKAVELRLRDTAKTLFYAWCYGAGDEKLGTIIYLNDWEESKQQRFNASFQGNKRRQKLRRIGNRARAALVAGINGMEPLIELAKKRAVSPGYVKGLDGRRVHCRSQHAALNTLLQSAGALVMKKALVICDERLRAEGFIHGTDFGYVGNIHDELQIEAIKEEHAERIGQIAADSIRLAGEHFGFRCPLAGNYDVGDNWSETH